MRVRPSDPSDPQTISQQLPACPACLPASAIIETLAHIPRTHPRGHSPGKGGERLGLVLLQVQREALDVGLGQGGARPEPVLGGVPACVVLCCVVLVLFWITLR